MKVIGVTGGVGAGKSTVLEVLEEKGACVIQADLIGHLVMEPGGSCYEAVVSLFGKSVIKEDKTIDRKQVSDVVFQVAEKREALNRIIHPAVKRSIMEKLAEERKKGRKLCVVEAALLLDDNYQAFCDEVWYVRTEESVRIRRLMESRGYSEEKSRSIIANQRKDEEFLQAADFVIDNSGTPLETRRQIEERLRNDEIM